MLSSEDLAFAASAGSIIAKNRIIQEVYELFGLLAEKYKVAASYLPETLLKQHPKISRGENYLGLPWVILDYPRNFTGPNVFAIRTMFWWGKYFSLQLLLQGKFMERLNVTELNSLTAGNEWFFCIGDNIWQHHFEENYMMPAGILTPKIIVEQQQNGFYKIGVKLPVTEWNNAEEFFTQKFNSALAILKHSQLP